jgi:hypothetical protein
LAIIGNLVCNKNSPDNRRIIAKLFYTIIKLSVFLPQSGNCGAAGALQGCRSIAGLQEHCRAAGALQGCRSIAGLQEHGGVRGERQFPPKSELFSP